MGRCLVFSVDGLVSVKKGVTATRVNASAFEASWLLGKHFRSISMDLSLTRGVISEVQPSQQPNQNAIGVLGTQMQTRGWIPLKDAPHAH